MVIRMAIPKLVTDTHMAMAMGTGLVIRDHITMELEGELELGITIRLLQDKARCRGISSNRLVRGIRGEVEEAMEPKRCQV